MMTLRYRTTAVIPIQKIDGHRGNRVGKNWAWVAVFECLSSI